jgi:hypothetical protein
MDALVILVLLVALAAVAPRFSVDAWAVAAPSPPVETIIVALAVIGPVVAMPRWCAAQSLIDAESSSIEWSTLTK